MSKEPVDIERSVLHVIGSSKGKRDLSRLRMNQLRRENTASVAVHLLRMKRRECPLDKRKRAVTMIQAWSRTPRNTPVLVGTSHRGRAVPLKEDQSRRADPPHLRGCQLDMCRRLEPRGWLQAHERQNSRLSRIGLAPWGLRKDAARR